MDFNVVITDRAQDDIDENTLFIATDSPNMAAKWKNELESLILALSSMPTRFPSLPESSKLEQTYRSAAHYSHRVVFRIDETTNTVFIVRVYHGARKPLAQADVDQA